jgi:hypothetical protein
LEDIEKEGDKKKEKGDRDGGEDNLSKDDRERERK